MIRSTQTATGFVLLLAGCGGRTGVFADSRTTSESGAANGAATSESGGASGAATSAGGSTASSAGGAGGDEMPPATPCRARDLGNALGFPIAEGVLAGASANATRCGGAGPEAWFRWTAPFSAAFHFAATNDGRGLIVAAYDDTMGCGRLSLVACQSGEPAIVSLAQNESVLLVVDTDETGGGFVLDAWGAAGNAARGCADVDVSNLAIGVVRVGYFTDAHQAVLFPCTGDVVPAVITSWTAPRRGYYVFDTTGSSADTLLDMRPDCSGKSLGCSDDYSGRAARLQLFFEAGEAATIFIGAKGVVSSEAHYVLRITESN